MNNSTVNFTLEASPNSTQSRSLAETLNLFVYAFSFLTGFPTHSYIIWLIVSGAGSGVGSEFFILNLSICEAGFSVDCLAFVLAEWLTFLVDLKVFLVGLVLTGRPLFQSLICVERYLAVVHPVTFLKIKPLRYRVICCTTAWILVLGSCLCCLYTIVPYRTVHIWFMSVQLVFFISIQLFCLVAVLRALKQSGPGDRRRKEENHMKRRAFIVILITTVSMVITYVPFNIIGFVTLFRGEFDPAHWLPGVICYVICGFAQPVLYLHRIGKLSCPCLL